MKLADLTHTQREALGVLAGMVPCTRDDLAEELSHDQPPTTRRRQAAAILAGLQQKKLAVRRGEGWDLTPLGRRLAGQLPARDEDE
jgi:hypothetical protein